MLSEKALNIFKSIDFLNRYKNLSDQFQHSSNENQIIKDELQNIHEVDKNFKYNKKENFFSLKEEAENIEFRLNFSFKYGMVESIIWAHNKNTKEKFGGPLSRISKLIQIQSGVKDIKRIKYPRFNSKSELKFVLSEVYKLYSDFKKEIVQDFKGEIDSV